MSNSLNLSVANLKLQVISGGTNASTQVMDGLNYYDGTKITSISNLTYNGSNAVLFSGSFPLTQLTISTSLTGSSNAAVLALDRGDAANGLATLNYTTLGTDQWSIGLRTADSDYHLYDRVNSIDRFIFKQTGNLLITALTASTLTGTNSSKELVSGALTGDITTSGFAATIANNAVTNAKIRQSAPVSVIGNSVFSVGNVADITAAIDGQILRRLGNVLDFGSINLASSISVGSSVLAATNGGTGQSSYAIGDIIYASGTSTLSKLADVATGNALISGGVSTAPSWGKIDVTTHITGTLPFANGGFGFSTATTGDLFYASGTNTPGKLADVATGSVLVSGGVGAAPSYSTGPSLQQITLSGLNTFALVFTDSTKRLTTTVQPNPQTLQLTGTTSYGANRIIFQNSGNTAFSSAASLTYDAANTFTFSTTGAPFFTVKSTTTGSSNEGAIRLDRGDSANGYAQLHFAVAASDEWAIGTRAGTTVFNWFSVTGGANVMTLSSGGDLTNLLGNVIINTVNKGIQIKGAAVSAGTANASFVTSVVLVAGTVTVNNSFVTTACCGSVAVVTAGGTPGKGYRLDVGAGTFTVTSDNPLDTSTLNVVFFKGI